MSIQPSSSRGYVCLALENVKNVLNVGSVLRAAGCFGAAMVVTSGRRYARTPTDTQKDYRRIPLVQCDDLRLVIPFDCVPVAVDLIEGAVPLAQYKHPERAFYVFGPEDGTLSHSTVKWCRDVVYIPMSGCMNLGACTNVVLYDRAVKRNEWSGRQVV